MTPPLHARNLSSLPILVLHVLLIAVPTLAATCSTGAEFSCPNCGGITVSSCSKCDGYLFTDVQYELCYDRNLFHVNGEEGNSDTHYPFLVNDLVASVLWFFVAGFAISCGVGGGSLYVPLGIILLRFPPKNASGLSQASIFGATLGGLFVNARTHHPNEHIRDTKGIPSNDRLGKTPSDEKGLGPAAIAANRTMYLSEGDGKHKFYTRPVIDFDMALFLAPMELAGATLGVIIQRLLPDWLYLIIAALVLGFTGIKTFQKFRLAYKQDKRDREVAHQLQLAEERGMLQSTDNNAEEKKEEDGLESENEKPDENEGMIDVEVDNISTSMKEKVANTVNSSTDESEAEQKELKKRREFLQVDSRQYPKEKIASFILLWMGLTVLTLLKGGRGLDSVIGIDCEDPGFQILTLAQFLWLFGFSTFFGFRNKRRIEERKAVHYPFLETDLLWDFKLLRFLGLFTFFSGIVAGLIGIGAGNILGPILIINGIHPSVSTATTAMMILLTSSSVAVMFVMSGLVPWEYAVYYFSICVCGAFIGKRNIDAYVKRTKMSSVIIGALTLLIAIGTIGCIVILFLTLASVDWCLDGFKPFCNVNKVGGCPSRFLSEAEEMFRIN